MTIGTTASGSAIEPRHRRRYAYAALLAAVAGAVDATGFLQFKTFYVSFMSGNTTQTAVAVAHSDGALVWRGVAIIAAFVAGVVIGDLLTGAPPLRQRVTLIVEAVLLLVASVAGVGLIASLMLAAAMGMHNALVLRAERIGIALTYVTGTLVHVGRGIAARIAGRPGPSIGLYVVLWLALAIGAAAGALAARHGVSKTLVGIACLLLLLCLFIRPIRSECHDQASCKTVADNH